jgi:hypothetical protein
VYVPEVLATGQLASMLQMIKFRGYNPIRQPFPPKKKQKLGGIYFGGTYVFLEIHIMGDFHMLYSSSKILHQS